MKVGSPGLTPCACSAHTDDHFIVSPSSRRLGCSASSTASGPPTRSIAAASRACARADRVGDVAGACAGCGCGGAERPRGCASPSATGCASAPSATTGSVLTLVPPRRLLSGLERGLLLLAQLRELREERPPVPLGSGQPAAAAAARAGPAAAAGRPRCALLRPSAARPWRPLGRRGRGRSVRGPGSRSLGRARRRACPAGGACAAPRRRGRRASLGRGLRGRSRGGGRLGGGRVGGGRRRIRRGVGGGAPRRERRRRARCRRPAAGVSAAGAGASAAGERRRRAPRRRASAAGVGGGRLGGGRSAAGVGGGRLGGGRLGGRGVSAAGVVGRRRSVRRRLRASAAGALGGRGRRRASSAAGASGVGATAGSPRSARSSRRSRDASSAGASGATAASAVASSTLTGGAGSPFPSEAAARVRARASWRSRSCPRGRASRSWCWTSGCWLVGAPRSLELRGRARAGRPGAAKRREAASPA